VVVPGNNGDSGRAQPPLLRGLTMSTATI
jgi:hypothetical protein